MNGTWVAVIGIVAPLVVTVLGAWWTRRTAREAQQASPYEALAKRVVDLEVSDAKRATEIENQKAELTTQRLVIQALQTEVGSKGDEIVQLRDEVHTLVAHSITVQTWIDAGMPPPPPDLPDNVARLMRRLRDSGHIGPLTPRLDPQG